MDCHQESGFAGGNVVKFKSGNPGNGVNEDWGPGSINQAVWATEDGMWNSEASADTNSESNHEGRLLQCNSGSEPPNKRARNSLLVDLAISNPSKAIGKMFYRTKLCCKFRVGNCPYVNCNFAHSIEELREPPLNWQEIVAAHKEEQTASEPKEEFPIPTLGSSDETQGSNIRKHCKKFCTEEGCPYGEDCNFIHDEQSKDRETVAICLVSGTGDVYQSNRSKPTFCASNWKTRICNKWEQTGYCPFGSKCHFAHGAEELHRYGGGLVNPEVKDSSICDTTQGAVPAKASLGTVDRPVASYSYHIGGPSQRLSSVIPKTEEKPTRRWKGPDKISKIYGDWIDDL